MNTILKGHCHNVSVYMYRAGARARPRDIVPLVLHLSPVTLEKGTVLSPAAPRPIIIMRVQRASVMRMRKNISLDFLNLFHVVAHN